MTYFFTITVFFWRASERNRERERSYDPLVQKTLVKPFLSLSPKTKPCPFFQSTKILFVTLLITLTTHRPSLDTTEGQTAHHNFISSAIKPL